MREYLWNLLIATSKMANVAAGPALNSALRPTIALFGAPDETLSRVFAKNAQTQHCAFCRLICRLLHRIDPNHCTKSIEPAEGRTSQE